MLLLGFLVALKGIVKIGKAAIHRRCGGLSGESIVLVDVSVLFSESFEVQEVVKLVYVELVDLGASAIGAHVRKLP